MRTILNGATGFTLGASVVHAVPHRSAQPAEVRRRSIFPGRPLLLQSINLISPAKAAGTAKGGRLLWILQNLKQPECFTQL